MIHNLLGKKVKANIKTRGTWGIKHENKVRTFREGKIMCIHSIKVASYPYLIRWDNNKSAFYSREEFDVIINKQIFNYII